MEELMEFLNSTRTFVSEHTNGREHDLPVINVYDYKGELIHKIGYNVEQDYLAMGYDYTRGTGFDERVYLFPETESISELPHAIEIFNRIVEDYNNNTKPKNIFAV